MAPAGRASGSYGQAGLCTNLSCVSIASIPGLGSLAQIISHLDYCSMLYARPSGSCNWSRIQQHAQFWVSADHPSNRVALASSCFLGQFKVLLITFKALCGPGPGYIQYCLSLNVSVLPTSLNRMNVLQVNLP